jgi:4-carboxymuconolactone decarboxylase
MGTVADRDIEERMQEIAGAPPRVAALDQAVVEEAAVMLIKKLAASAGNPQTEFPVINRYLRTVIKHPALFEAHVQMGRALFAGAIPARERELAVLRVAWLCRAPYEWGEHVKIAKQCGISSAEIEQIVEGSSCQRWAAADRAILRGVEELITNHMISDETWQVLACHWEEQQLIEFPMMVGQYIATACVQNALRVPLAKHNTGLWLR